MEIRCSNDMVDGALVSRSTIVGSSKNNYTNKFKKVKIRKSKYKKSTLVFATFYCF